MTVCIGAICENGACTVVAADEMVTFGAPMNLQTEPPGLKKINTLTVESVLLYSGTVPDGEEMVRQTRRQIGGIIRPLVEQVAEFAKNSYVMLKRRRIEETILRPLIGADFPQYQNLIAQAANSALLQNLLGMIAQHNLQTDLLIAGEDDIGHHIFIVTHPGICLPMDTLGFAAIGSGGLHASISLSLGGQAKTATLAQTLYNVFEAKKASEVAPGVGKLTDIAILKNRTVIFVQDGAIDVLERVHRGRPTLSEQDQHAISGALG